MSVVTAAAVSESEPAPVVASQVWALRWRRARMPAALVLLVALTIAVVVFADQGGTREAYDPKNPKPEGALALANILRNEGSEVLERTKFTEVAADLSDSSTPTTVFITRPDNISGSRMQDLRALLEQKQPNLVLVGAQNRDLANLKLPLAGGPDVQNSPEPKPRNPGCDATVATRAGSVDFGSQGYSILNLSRAQSATGAAKLTSYQLCYSAAKKSAMADLTFADEQQITTFVDGEFLTNGRLAKQGNASLILSVLGRTPRVIWWSPSRLDVNPTAVSEDDKSLTDFMPDGVRFAAWQLIVALLFVVVWRTRRLGRLSTESLPVVVRAIETTQGRAVLYRRARARGRSAQVLRAATVRRLALRCGLSHHATPETVAQAVAAATGRELTEVSALLIGPDPTKDVTLVLLARALLALEEEVQKS